MISKCYGLIGLATKAGKVISGTELCEQNIRSNKAKLVIVSAEASELTKKSIKDACNYKKVEYKIFGTKEELGKYTGKDERMVIAILDTNFAEKISKLIDEESSKRGEKYGE